MVSQQQKGRAGRCVRWWVGSLQAYTVKAAAVHMLQVLQQNHKKAWLV